jgi:hypothetical protein
MSANDILPVYNGSPAEQLRTFLSGVRMKLSRRPVLIAGPYAGEFGIEIIKFQSYVRALAPRYDAVHVITYPGRAPLYRAENVTVHEHGFDLKTAGYWYGRRSFHELNAYAQDFARRNGIQNYDLFNTSLLCTGWHRKLLWKEAHVPFSSRAEPPPGRYDVIFHFRAINKAGPDASRNYQPQLAEQLAGLCVQSGLRCACIGHPGYSLCAEGCADFRTEDLDCTIAALCAGRLLAGELSGPVHLAVYCARPVVTWAPDPHRIAYAKRHNPFSVDIGTVTDGSTNPAPADVFLAIRQHLKGTE